MKLHRKVAIVTGGGRGIGRAICQAFSESGARIVVADIDLGTAERTASELKGLSGESVAVRVDVSNAVEVSEMVKRTIEQFGRIDILVNNAGVGIFRSVEACTEEEWDCVLAVNLKGSFLCAKHVMEPMKAQRSGVMVHIASVAGKVGGIVAGAPYAAAKAGLISLTKSLAKELAPYGIRSNAICPGIIDTEMTAHHPPELIEQIPFRRKGRPEDIATCACFLASDDAPYITGEIVDVNGGLVMD